MVRKMNASDIKELKIKGLRNWVREEIKSKKKKKNS